MDFRYADLADDQVLTAYERLLLDAMKGDATLLRVLMPYTRHGNSFNQF